MNRLPRIFRKRRSRIELGPSAAATTEAIARLGFAQATERVPLPPDFFERARADIASLELDPRKLQGFTSPS